MLRGGPDAGDHVTDLLGLKAASGCYVEHALWTARLSPYPNPPATTRTAAPAHAGWSAFTGHGLRLQRVSHPSLLRVSELASSRSCSL